MAVGGAALTAGMILQEVLQGHPQVIEQIMAWGPATLVILGGFWLVNKWAPPFIEAQQRMAANVGELSGAIRANLSRDDDVRDTMRTLAAKMDRHHELVMNHIAKKEAAQ